MALEKKFPSKEQHISNPREAAYLALLDSYQGKQFIAESIGHWREASQPSARDLHFVQQLAFGTVQMALALDHLGEQVAHKKKLSLKRKERLLLRLAIYQYYFLERVPLYAIADEMMQLAKKYCHPSFANFLNAILRKLPETDLSLPEADSYDALSVRYSYPQFFVEQLWKAYGLEKAKEILRLGNQPALLMARVRNPEATVKSEPLKLFCEDPFPFIHLQDSSQLSVVTQSKDFYIQNITPAYLIRDLFSGITPARILDLCASPGGKLITIHDLFSEAKLFGNDISEEKVKILEENCLKYEVEATLSCSKGEEFSSQERFDLIILDVPCSNSGVLNKRAEARWRLEKENLCQLEEMQWRLLCHANSLLAPQGELWYMTCSILPQENERMIERACKMLGKQVKKQVLVLPNEEGWDGGFGCALI